MKGRIAGLVASVLLVLTPVVCSAQDFSADVAYDPSKPHDASSHPVMPSSTSKIFVSKDKMRLESRGFSQTIMLVDFTAQTTTAIYPAQKAYQPLASRPRQYFRVSDVENACPDWQVVAGKQFTCEKAGKDTVDGRKAVKYLNKNAAAGGSTAAIWIDPALKFVIKWEDATGGAELHNITEGPQAAELFVVPASYDVLKPRKKPVGRAPRPR